MLLVVEKIEQRIHLKKLFHAVILTHRRLMKISLRIARKEKKPMKRKVKRIAMVLLKLEVKMKDIFLRLVTKIMWMML